MVLSMVGFGSSKAGKFILEPKLTSLAVTRISSAHRWDLKLEVGKSDFGAKCDLFSSSHNLLFLPRGPENKETRYEMLIMGGSEVQALSSLSQGISSLPPFQMLLIVVQ